MHVTAIHFPIFSKPNITISENEQPQSLLMKMQHTATKMNNIESFVSNS